MQVNRVDAGARRHYGVGDATWLAACGESDPGFTPQMDMQDPEDEAFDTVEPDEPALDGKDGTGPPPSATPNKHDREDLLGGEDSSEEPETRDEILQGLYDQLHRAKDSKSAEPIAKRSSKPGASQAALPSIF